MSYKKVLSKLQRLPKAEKELAAGQYVFSKRGGKTHCGCAIGKLLPEEVRLALYSSAANKSGVGGLLSYLHISNYRDSRSARYRHFDLFAETGMTEKQALRLLVANDEGEGVEFRPNSPGSRRARYRRVIAWLKARA